VDGDKDFKFNRQVECSKSRPSDDKSSLKEAWSAHVNHLNFDGLKLEWSHFVHRWAI